VETFTWVFCYRTPTDSIFGSGNHAAKGVTKLNQLCNALVSTFFAL